MRKNVQRDWIQVPIPRTVHADIITLKAVEPATSGSKGQTIHGYIQKLVEREKAAKSLAMERASFKDKEWFSTNV